MDNYRCNKCGNVQSVFIEYWSPNSDTSHSIKIVYNHENCNFNSKRYFSYDHKISEPTSQVEKSATFCFGCRSLVKPNI